MSNQSIGNLSANLAINVDGAVAPLRQVTAAYERLTRAQKDFAIGPGTIRAIESVKGSQVASALQTRALASAGTQMGPFPLNRAEYTSELSKIASSRIEAAKVKALRPATEAVRNLGNTAEDSLKGFSKAGLAMQQFGYQAQDMAVQVMGGTNALVALSQQGSQMLGFLGGWKFAMAGAILSAGILGYRMYDLADSADKTALAYKNQTEALNGLIAAARELDLLRNPEKQRKYLELDLQQAKATARRASMELLAAQARFAISSGPNYNAPYIDIVGMIGKYNSKTNLDEASRRLSEYQAKISDAVKALETFDQAETKSAEEATKRADVYRMGDSLFSLRNANTQIGEDDLAKLARLNQLFASVASTQVFDELGVSLGIDKERLEQIRGEILGVTQSLANEAMAITDSLNPLEKKRREFERINKLVEANVGLTRQQANEYLAQQDAESLARAALPSAFTDRNSASSLGLLLGGQGQVENAQLEVQKQMLSALRSIYTAVGPN